MAPPKPNKEFVVPIIPADIVLDEVPMRAYCGKAIYAMNVRPTEEGVENFRQDVVLDLQMTEGNGPAFDRVLVSIPGGKA